MTAQRSIEQAIRDGLENDTVKIGDVIDATMTSLSDVVETSSRISIPVAAVLRIQGYIAARKQAAYRQQWTLI